MAEALKHTVRLIRRAYNKFSADRCARVGAALAYYTFFSLFPLLLLLISVLSYLLASGVPLLVDARAYVLGRAYEIMPQAQDALQRSIDAALSARGQVGFVGLLTLLWSASNVFTQLYQALNIIWSCTPEPTIGAAIRTKLTAIAMVFGISFILLLSIVFNAGLAVAIHHIQPLPWWRTVWTTLGPLSSVGMATAIFALLYRYLPDTKVRWRHVWPGALLAGTVWEFLRQAFTVYVTRYANYTAVYGAVGSTLGLLSWIYLSAQVLLFGAEFSVVYQQFQTEPRAEAHPSRRPDGADAQPSLRAQVVAAWRQLSATVAEAWGRRAAPSPRPSGARPGRKSPSSWRSWTLVLAHTCARKIKGRRRITGSDRTQTSKDGFGRVRSGCPRGDSVRTGH